MSEELLRKAATLMRERAQKADASGDGEPWYPAEELHDCIGGGSRNTADSEHMSSWTPEVALAVANWLDHARDAHLEVRIGNYPTFLMACIVARAYLGEADNA